MIDALRTRRRPRKTRITHATTPINARNAAGYARTPRSKSRIGPAVPDVSAVKTRTLATVPGFEARNIGKRAGVPAFDLSQTRTARVVTDLFGVYIGDGAGVPDCSVTQSRNRATDPDLHQTIGRASGLVVGVDASQA